MALNKDSLVICGGASFPLPSTYELGNVELVYQKRPFYIMNPDPLLMFTVKLTI